MTSSLQLSKQALRKEVKMRLKSLTVDGKRDKSAVVCRKVLEHPAYRTSTRISLFLSMADEVNTLEILKDALATNKTCFIPRYDANNMEMVLLRSYDDYLQLPETQWKIKQPPLDDNSRPESIHSGGLDLMIVPGLAFTLSGHRLGRGKGYYDKYLNTYAAVLGRLPTTIGLAFKEQIYEQVPVSDSDVLLDDVVTD